MRLLAIDTSSARVAVAVHDGSRVLASRLEGDGRHHAERLAPAVAAALRDAGTARAELTAIAVGVGPGPYTSLRIGLVTARVMGHALGVPVHGICSLDALAEQAATDPGVGRLLGGRDLLVTADARRREVYWARYRERDGRRSRVEGPAVASPGAVPVEDALVVGRGVALYPETFGTDAAAVADGVDAGTLASLAAAELSGTADPSGGLLLPVEPLYLRPPDAVEPTSRKRVLGPATR